MLDRQLNWDRLWGAYIEALQEIKDPCPSWRQLSHLQLAMEALKTEFPEETAEIFLGSYL